jgi:MFS family permease
MVERSVAQQWDLPAVETSESTSESKEEPTRSGDFNAIQTAPQAENASDSEKAVVKPLPAWLQKMPPFITLLRIPRILVALFGCFVMSTALAAFDSSLPLYVKNIFSWNSTGAGLIFICLVIPALVSPVAGYVSDKYGSRIITTVGLLGSVPFWVLLRYVTHNTIQQKVLLCALLSLIGLCMTFIMAPLMADIDHAVALEEKKRPGSLGKRGAAAQGFGLFNFAFALGTLIGPLWAGFVIQDAGWGTMVWTLGLLSGVAAITTFLFTGGRIMLKGKESEGVV